MSDSDGDDFSEDDDVAEEEDDDVTPTDSTEEDVDEDGDDPMEGESSSSKQKPAPPPTHFEPMDEESANPRQFQKINWQLSHFPNYQEIEADADEHFRQIKAGLARSILLRSPRPGFVHWAVEFERYTMFHAFRFTKTEHVWLVKIFYEQLIAPGQELSIVKLCCTMIKLLLKKRELLSRADLQVDWRPIHDLYIKVAYKNLEEDGIYLMPESMKSTLEGTIQKLRNHWKDEATQELLDEIRPYFCPFDDSMLRAWALFTLFMPTSLHRNEHEKFGASLWLDEAWHWLEELESYPYIECKILRVLARLCAECPGFHPLTSDRLSTICSRLLRALRINLGYGRSAVDCTDSIEPASAWLVLQLDRAGLVQKEVSRLLQAVESHLHPSNSTASHASSLLILVHRLAHALVVRVKRERFTRPDHRPTWSPDERLTDAQIDAFVQSILPAMRLMMFAKRRNEVSNSVIHGLAAVAPRLVIPVVLDAVYPSLETVTEPHRLQQSLQALFQILLPLVRDRPKVVQQQQQVHDSPRRRGGLEKRKKPASKSGQGDAQMDGESTGPRKHRKEPTTSSATPPDEDDEWATHVVDGTTTRLSDPTRTYRAHTITLMEALLPALDANDVNKSLLAFQILGVLFVLVPLVDCSDAPQLRSDLSEDEKELCSATANLEGIVEQLVDKMLAMVAALGDAGHAGSGGAGRRAAATHKVEHMSIEETIIRKGAVTVFKAMILHAAPNFRRAIADKVFEFVRGTIQATQVGAECSGELLSNVVRTEPETFPKFFKLVSEKLKGLITEETIASEERLDNETAYWLALVPHVMKARGEVLVKHEREVTELLSCGGSVVLLPVNWDQPTTQSICSIIEPLRCPKAANFVGSALFDCASALASSQWNYSDTIKTRLAQPLDQYLPIQHWGAALDKRKCRPELLEPSADATAMLQRLLDRFFFSALEKLADGSEELSKTEQARKMDALYMWLAGSAPLIDWFDSPIVRNAPTAEGIPIYRKLQPLHTSNVKLLTAPDGSTKVREWILAQVGKLTDRLLQPEHEYTKSLSCVARILSTVLFSRGIDRTKFETSQSMHRTARLLANDTLRGAKGLPEFLAHEYFSLLHAKRFAYQPGHAFTEQHLVAMRLLYRLAISSYAHVRDLGQRVLSNSFLTFPYSFRHFVDETLELLKDASPANHKRFKGALYILQSGRVKMSVRNEWAILRQVWPALATAAHSEKTSVVMLHENLQNVIVKKFECYRIRFESSPAAMSEARKLWALQLPDAEASKPALELPTDVELAQAEENEKKTNAENARLYAELCDELCRAAESSVEHWRSHDMAHTLLSLLIRMDEPTPDSCVKLFTRLLIHDAVKTRRTACAFISAWLKITKPLALKVPYPDLQVPPNQGAGAKWPIVYGLRADNRFMQYDDADIPGDASDWDARRYLNKQHWGYYTWPVSYKTYAPLTEQTAANREELELSDADKFLIAQFRSSDFMRRFVELSSIEEKKGEDLFNAVGFAFFYGLFRNYNTALWPVFHEQLEKLLADPTEGKQRLASEIVGGLLNGSKLWRFDRLRPMWEWLAPRLSQCLENANNEGAKNWGTSVATVFGSVDPRALAPYIRLLFDLLARPTNNAFHTTTRLYLVQGAVNQTEWRGLQLWQRLDEAMRPLIGQSYNNVRERIGSCLCSTTSFIINSSVTDAQIYVNDMRPCTIENLAAFLRTLLTDVDQEVWRRSKQQGAGSSGAENPNESASDASTTNDDGKKVAKNALRTAINMMSSVMHQNMQTLNASLLFLIPYFAHYENETSDEELKTSCANMRAWVATLAVVGDHNQDELIALFEETLASTTIWWKARVSLLKYLEALVFANMWRFLPVAPRIVAIVERALMDLQLEVRDAAAQTLSGLVHTRFVALDAGYIRHFSDWAALAPLDAEAAAKRHAGVLGLAAAVLAFPYSVPRALPALLVQLSRHLHDKPPINLTVRKTLGEFRRTHQDCWHEHKRRFSDDQLSILTDLLVSPNYYV